MESSQVFGGAEECHSSESGWTMYIGSPTYGAAAATDDSDDDESHSDGDDHDGCNNGYEDDDSDDSMASDASSGPSHRENPYRSDEHVHGHGVACFKHDKGKDKHSSQTKAKKQVEKQRAERKKEEKEEPVFIPERTHTPSVQSGSKVRRHSWMGKRK